MFESGDGLATADTRQCGGSCSGPGGGPPAPGAAGGMNGPAATACAAVIVVFGRESDFRSAQAPGLDRASRSASSMQLPPGRTGGVYLKESGVRYQDFPIPD